LALHRDLLRSVEVGDGQQAEVAGGAGQVPHCPASYATFRQAAAAVGVSKTIGHYWLTQSGGVRSRIRRPRSPLRLSLEDRETISRGLAQKKTLTAIAGELGRSVSTVSREVARNSGPTATALQGPTVWRCCGQTGRPGKLADDLTLRRYLEESCGCVGPQQITRCFCGPKPCLLARRLRNSEVTSSRTPAARTWWV
jgi:hypothetical protein